MPPPGARHGKATTPSHDRFFQQSHGHSAAVPSESSPSPSVRRPPSSKKRGREPAPALFDFESADTGEESHLEVEDEERQEGPSEVGVEENGPQAKKRKKKKNAPVEMSSKHPTPLPSLSSSLLRPKSLLPRDPRFDLTLPSSSFSSTFNSRAAYSFLTDLQQEELQSLRQQQKKVHNQERKVELTATITREVQKVREGEKKEREKTALREWRKEEERRRKEGKGKFWLKERDRKKVQLVADYVAMQEKGQMGAVQKRMEKKRKQRKAADQRSMPYDTSQ